VRMRWTIGLFRMAFMEVPLEWQGFGRLAERADWRQSASCGGSAASAALLLTV
jgi:hypothetical protein